MKKVALLVLLAIVASTLLMAAVPTKMVRLTMINKSGSDVFMKLTGSAVTDAFYYLTVPSGDTDVPTIKVFTVMSDLYDRETWQCEGVRSAGTLIVSGNIRLTFTPCGQFRSMCKFYNYVGEVDGVDTWEFIGSDPCNRGGTLPFVQAGWGLLDEDFFTVGARLAGEPTMEKVTYFRYLSYGDPTWTDAYLYNGFWSTGCATLWWRSRTWRTPVGCEWRYQY